jgi:hypothetical protein
MFEPYYQNSEYFAILFDGMHNTLRELMNKYGIAIINDESGLILENSRQRLCKGDYIVISLVNGFHEVNVWKKDTFELMFSK